MCTDYSSVTTEQFDAELSKLIDEGKASDLLTIPGVYELVAEHHNNDVLDRCDREAQ